jgi:DNA-binding GntR family transcriptional regulator
MEIAFAKLLDVPQTTGLLQAVPPRFGSAVTLRQATERLLRAQIISGVLPPGALLRETSLSQQLGISATPVREALGTLASEGLVEIEAHRLKRVAPIDMRVTADLIRVQAELWALGYRWGMPRIGPVQLAVLEEAMSRYRAALSASEYMAAIYAGLDFHTVFITASRNGELLRSTLDRRGLIARFIFLHGIQTLSASGLSQHQAILDAFVMGDHATVLTCLEQMAARLIALCGGEAQTPSITSKD